MTSKLRARFMPEKNRTLIAAPAMAVLLIFFESICFCAQSQQNPAEAGDKPPDANAVSAIDAVPQDALLVESAAELNIEQIEARKKQIADSEKLSDELKTKIAETYDRAITQLKLAADYEARKQQYSQARKEVPETLVRTKGMLAGQDTFTPPEAAPEITLTEAEQKLTAARLALDEAKNKVATWENEPKRRAERRTKIPEETNAANQRLEEIKAKLAIPGAEGQKTEMMQANQTLLLAQRKALENQIAANTEELLLYDAAVDLLAVRRDLAARQLAAAEKVVAFWQQKVDELRQKQAQAAKKEAIRAKEETKFDNPALWAIAEENAKLAEIQAKLVTEIQKVNRYSEKIDANLAEIKSGFEEIRAKVETAGKVTDAMGMILLGRRDKLPNISINLRNIKDRAARISLAQFEEIERDRQWSELRDLTDEIKEVMAQLDPSMGEEQREAIKKQAISYYESQRDMLRTVADRYGEYAAELANLDTREREYVNTVQEFANFLDANILWVRSSPALRLGDLAACVSAVGWLVSPANWYQTLIVLWGDFKANIPTYMAILLIIISWFALRPKACSRLEELAEKVHQVQTDSFKHTVKAFGLTVFLAATWPVILFLFQWRLSTASLGQDYSQALALALHSLVPVVFILSFLLYFAIPNGLAQSHLRMRQEPLFFLRRWLKRYFPLAIITTFVVEFMHVQQASEQWYNSAGRLFLMAGLIALAFILLLLLRPTGPLVESFLRQRQDGWLERLRYLWYPLCFVLPVVFAVLAGMGYFYAVRQLYEKFVFTLLLILLAILVRAMFVRWLMVAQRRLALLERQKRERQAAELEALEKGQSAYAAEPQQGKVKEEATIFQISRQTRRLIDVITVFLPIGGIWYVWSDFLPALGSIAETELWSVADEQTVTLGSLAIALLVVALTVIVARNVPGLLEIIILRKLPLDRGVRFAISTLFRYTLVVFGVVLAFSQIGISWSKVQWLIAAMTVGLGFGLQEIFANFVSGLIILFEQPIRVDDVVTIGDVTGKVSKIRIRATTIRRWDQRELLVPNKEFITGRLINWTLSDNVLRREFVVGIAYGSDIAKAEKILYDVARDNPLVLKEPVPMVIFKNFGNSSLEFELRVYIAGIENYLPVWHSINCAIDTEFRKAGIEIAFPQHDLHIRSADTSVPININKPEMPDN